MKEINWFNGAGKIDDLVVYDHRGQKCARRIGKSRVPPSPAQLAQRKRMASAVIFYQAMKEVGIVPYWEEAAKGQKASGYNLQVGANILVFGEDGAIGDVSKLQITPELLPLPDEFLVHEANGFWQLQWLNPLYLPGAADDDVLHLLLMRDGETFDPQRIDSGSACRRDGNAFFSIPEASRDYCHLFAFFCSRTGWKCTKSRYFNLNYLESHNYGKVRELFMCPQG